MYHVFLHERDGEYSIAYLNHPSKYKNFDEQRGDYDDLFFSYSNFVKKGNV